MSLKLLLIMVSLLNFGSGSTHKFCVNYELGLGESKGRIYIVQWARGEKLGGTT